MNLKMTAILKDRDIVRTLLAVLLVGSLISACFWILHPFLPAIIWATMVVVAIWPIMLGIQRRLWGKRGMAVILMTSAFFVLFVVPFALVIIAIMDSTDQIVAWSKSLANFAMPLPPEWLESLPIVGGQACPNLAQCF
jgi:predicted PurR-regulated permease PerM